MLRRSRAWKRGPREAGAPGLPCKAQSRVRLRRAPGAAASGAFSHGPPNPLSQSVLLQSQLLLEN